MDYLKKIKLADWLTLTGLFFSWISILLLLSEKPNWAIIVIMIAFLFDLLDGYVARKSDQVTKFGRELDSYGDIFIYLTFSSLLFYFYLAPNRITGLFVGFFILMFGGLRLIRFNIEGIKKEKQLKYYRGVTVVHVMFLTLICYFLKQLVSLWADYFSALVLLIASPTMISNYKSYKIESYWLFGLVIFCVVVTSLILEYAY